MCSSREQIYLLCPHMEVTQDVKLECKSYITIISHLDIPISVMSERPFLVLFMSLPKQFKTIGKTTFVFLLKKDPRGGVIEVALQGFPSTCLAKFNTPGKALLKPTWQKAACPPTYLPTCLPTYRPTWNSTFPGGTFLLVHHLQLLSTLQVQIIFSMQS